jgi:hypothetical protein
MKLPLGYFPIVRNFGKPAWHVPFLAPDLLAPPARRARSSGPVPGLIRRFWRRSRRATPGAGLPRTRPVGEDHGPSQFINVRSGELFRRWWAGQEGRMRGPRQSRAATSGASMPSLGSGRSRRHWTRCGRQSWLSIESYERLFTRRRNGHGETPHCRGREESRPARSAREGTHRKGAHSNCSTIY